MTDAVIIPFPSRQPRGAEPPAPVEAAGDGRAELEDGQARLAAALAGLRSALEEQRRALADWRFAMAELGIGMAGLGQSLHGYHAALTVADEKVGALREQAKKLEAWGEAHENPPEG